MATKMPSAKEILTDPKYTEQKGFFKELLTGLGDEIVAEKKKGKKKEEPNIFDSMFGGADDEEEDA